MMWVEPNSLYFMPDPSVPPSYWHQSTMTWDLGLVKMPISQVVPNEYGHDTQLVTSEELLVESACSCGCRYETVGEGILVTHNRLLPLESVGGLGSVSGRVPSVPVVKRAPPVLRLVKG